MLVLWYVRDIKKNDVASMYRSFVFKYIDTIVRI